MHLCIGTPYDFQLERFPSQDARAAVIKNRCQREVEPDNEGDSSPYELFCIEEAYTAVATTKLQDFLIIFAG